MQNVAVQILPGGMNSDKVPNALGATEYTSVVNLYQPKEGRWENVPGYRNLKTGLSDVRAAAEVTEDRTGERFILYQSGSSIYRLNYDSVNDYNTSPTLIALPSGVTIGSSAILRFFYFLGVVRITGASVPLHYSYVDRSLFPDANDVAGQLTVQQWVLEKDPLQQYQVECRAQHSLTAGSGSKSFFMKTFWVYDDAQYSLIEDISVSPALTAPATGAAIEVISGSMAGARFVIRIPAGILPLNKRITGLAVCIGSNDLNVYDPDNIVWRVAKVLDFSRDLGVLNYQHTDLNYDGTNGDRINFNSGVIQDGYFQVGQTVTFRTRWGAVENATVLAVSEGSMTGLEYIQLDTTIEDLFSGGVLPGSAEDLADTAITINLEWDYDAANGYDLAIGVDLLSGTDYYTFVDIPAGTEHHTPNYSHHVVIGGIAYIVSLEDDEEDLIRYSPIDQLSSFPINNIFATQTGDLDQVTGFVERDGRLFIMKSNSLSQGNFSGSAFYKDIGFSKSGLFSRDGYLEIDGFLYIVGREDLYLYAGGADVIGLLSNQRLRQHYLTRVTATSIIAYDKINGFIFVTLSDGWLCYHPERKEWFVRSTDITPICYILDQDQRMLIFSADKLVAFNHSLSADESINWSFQTAIVDDKQRDNFKKLIEWHMAIQALSAPTLTITDAIEGESSVSTISANASRVTDAAVRPQFLHKQFDLQVSGTGQVVIEEMRAVVGVWKGES